MGDIIPAQEFNSSLRRSPETVRNLATLHPLFIEGRDAARRCGSTSPRRETQTLSARCQARLGFPAMARLLVLVLLVAALAGCGGGSTEAAPAAVTGPVSVSGQVTFDLVPAVAGQGLSYAATVARPARGVTVELLQQGSVTASTMTDATGSYSFGSVAANTDVSLRVRAELLRVGAPSWDFRVVDNVNGDALYTLAGAVFNTGAAN